MIQLEPAVFLTCGFIFVLTKGFVKGFEQDTCRVFPAEKSFFKVACTFSSSLSFSLSRDTHLNSDWVKTMEFVNLGSVWRARGDGGAFSVWINLVGRSKSLTESIKTVKNIFFTVQTCMKRPKMGVCPGHSEWLVHHYINLISANNLNETLPFKQYLLNTQE